MNFSQDILLVILISTIATGTGTDLATNSNILLIILLALYCNYGNGCQNTCRCGFNNNLF